MQPMYKARFIHSTGQFIHSNLKDISPFTLQLLIYHLLSMFLTIYRLSTAH